MKQIFIIISFFTFLLCTNLLTASDTIKYSRIKIYGDAWSQIAFYSQFDKNAAIDYIVLLTKELEIIENNSESDSIFNISLDKIMCFSENRGNITLDSNIVESSYKLICNDLFDWIDSRFIEPEKQSYFRKIALYGIVKPEEGYTLIPPKLLTVESKKDKGFASLLNEIDINDKFDILSIYIYVFNAYKYLSNYPIDACNNDSIFYSFADKILKIEDSKLNQSYGWIMMQIMSSQKDSHLMTSFNNWPTPLNSYIKLAINDTNVIVTTVAKDFGIKYGIKPGDKIFSISETPVQIRNNYYKTLLEGSNTTVTNSRLANKTLIFNTNDTLVFFSTMCDGQIHNHNINLNAIESQPLPTDCFPDKFVILNDSTSYINFGKCNNDEFAKYLEASKKMTTVIIDNREYPSDINFSNKWGKYIVSSDRIFRYMLVPCDNKPGYNYFDSTKLSIINNSRAQNKKAEKFKSNKKFYFLSSEQTISQGEFYLSYFVEATDGIVVGRNTAGVPSNVRFFRLPSNINLTMSLLKVYDSDMNLISGKGILPDIYVKEDIVDYEQILKIIRPNND